MKTGKKIAVGLAAALVVTIFAAGAVSMVGAQLTEELDFTVEVSIFDVTVDIAETDFGTVLPGHEKVIHSFHVFNAGIVDADVEAKFLTNEGEESFGLVGGSVILAENFMLNGVPLNNDGIEAHIGTVYAGDDLLHDAHLLVPPLQHEANYLGTIELIFTPVIPAE